MIISYIAAMVIAIYVLPLEVQGMELKGKYVCTKIIRYEDREVYYERRKCTLKDVLAEILKINKQCTFKNKYITKKKYRTVYRYKKTYVCCHGYVKVGYKCIKGGTTERTTPTKMTTMPTTTPTTMNMTTEVHKTNSEIPIIVIILIAVTVVVVVLVCLLCVICCCKFRGRQNKNRKSSDNEDGICRSGSFEHISKDPLKGKVKEREIIYNDYDSCEFSTNEKSHAKQYGNNMYEDLHHYDNAWNDQREYECANPSSGNTHVQY